MKVKNFDDFKYPNRKPWLAIILVVLAVFLFFRWKSNKNTSEIDSDIRKDIDVQESNAGIEETTVEEEMKPSEDSPVRHVDVSQLLKEARAFDQNDLLLEAKNKYLKILEAGGSRKIRIEAERRIGEINIKLTFTPMAMPEKQDYIVKKGDFLSKIARKFGTTGELIQKSNKITNPNLIKVGDRLRVLTGKFNIRISKKRNDLLVYMNDKFFKRYLVGTGKYGKTPVGTFILTEKIKEPVWWRPDGKEVLFGDKENILGTRWMTLRAVGDTPDVRGYGIHGTWNNASIGKSESAGCIRMKNEEVEELFVLLPVNTPVVITE